MDIKKYEIVLNVIDHGTFAGICDEFGYTQSGITQMMKGVERELGFHIFLRSNKGIRLTGRKSCPISGNWWRLTLKWSSGMD